MEEEWGSIKIWENHSGEITSKSSLFWVTIMLKERLRCTPPLQIELCSQSGVSFMACMDWERDRNYLKWTLSIIYLLLKELKMPMSRPMLFLKDIKQSLSKTMKTWFFTSAKTKTNLLTRTSTKSLTLSKKWTSRISPSWREWQPCLTLALTVQAFLWWVASLELWLLINIWEDLSLKILLRKICKIWSTYTIGMDMPSTTTILPKLLTHLNWKES